MRKGIQAHFAQAGEKPACRGIARQIGAQHQRIDETADYVLDLGAAAVGDRRTHQDILLAAVTRKQQREAGEERHEESRSFASRKPTQRVGQLEGQREGVDFTAPAPHWRSRPIGRQLEHLRGPREARAPVRELGLQRFALQPTALPAREVAVPERKRRQHGRLSARKAPVQLAQLPGQDAQRPAVRNNVMHRQRQHVHVRREPVKLRAEQRTARQVEAARRFLAQSLACVGLTAHFRDWQRPRRRL